jgi:hypothetical protein
MAKLQYLNKRDDRGVLLRYSAHDLAFDVANRAFDLISSSEIYSILVSKTPQKYVDIFYQKMIYEAFLPLAHQLVIYQHDKDHNKINLPRTLDATGFPSKALLKEIWPVSSIGFSFSFVKLLKINVKEKSKDLLKGTKKICHMLLSFYKGNGILNQPNLESERIAVNYGEGFDPNERSDIFWFENSGIDPGSLIIYYENPRVMISRDDKQTAQEYFTKRGVKQVKLWQWNTSNGKTIFDKLKDRLESLQRLNNIDKWMCSTAVQLCKRLSFWRAFFNHNNIRIHLDSTENGLETIIKQMALFSVDGLSIGKVKSYPINSKGLFLGYYPNDIFFTWGEDSANRIEKTNPHIENILISGFPYKSSSRNKIGKSINTNKKSGKPKSPKFNLLLLDSNHSFNNKNFSQVVDSLVMERFYISFLEWVLTDDELQIIIKPKKSEFLTNLPKVVEKINSVEKTGRLNIISSAFQKLPNAYLKGIDMVVGISTFLPSAVFECVSLGKRAVFYDYSNMRYHEPDLYAWGENKVIFPDINVMISTLKAYKNDPSTNPHLGDWSAYKDESNPFRDNKGGERIGIYMRWLLDSFDKEKTREEAIENSNKLFSDSWGADKIYK